MGGLLCSRVLFAFCVSCSLFGTAWNDLERHDFEDAHSVGVPAQRGWRYKFGSGQPFINEDGAWYDIKGLLRLHEDLVQYLQDAELNITRLETDAKELLAKMFPTKGAMKKHRQLEDTCERGALFKAKPWNGNKTYLPHLFLSGVEPGTPSGHDCADILQKSNGTAASGVYTIKPRSFGGVKARRILVFCRMEGGQGWTVIQRRRDGKQSFYQNWNSYKFGFGHPCGNFWLGNMHIHLLTNQGKYALQIHMQAVNGEEKYASYSSFHIEGEDKKYKLRLGLFSGNVGDAMIAHNNNAFSSFDEDNDKSYVNCAADYKGGWWYNSCSTANLNGGYMGYIICPNRLTPKIAMLWLDYDFIIRGPFIGDSCPLKYVEMAIAPMR